jgi:head-tail adaptor
MAGRVPVLNRRMVLEDRVRVADGAGGFAETWEGLGTLWAAMEARRGGEVAREALPASAVRYRITVRAAPPGRPERPRADQRLREGTRVFRILAVAEADRGGRFLVCEAIEEEISA